MGSVVKSAWKAVKKVGKAAVNTAKKVGKAVVNVAKNVGKTALNVVAKTGKIVLNAGKTAFKIGEKVAKTTWDVGKKVLGTTFGLAKKVGKAVVNVAKNVGKTAWVVGKYGAKMLWNTMRLDFADVGRDWSKMKQKLKETWWGKQKDAFLVKPKDEKPKDKPSLNIQKPVIQEYSSRKLGLSILTGLFSPMKSIFHKRDFGSYVRSFSPMLGDFSKGIGIIF